VRSTHRFLNKRHRAHQMETLLMESIKKLARATQPHVKRELFTALRDGLRKLLKDPHEGTVLNYFDFLSWAESKVKGVPYAQEVRDRSRQLR
jgi:vacuolar-type H+-ATPase subunit E/Vma4